MERCHLVVFNCDRIRLLLDSFWRVRAFDPARDRLIVIDCSTRPRDERRRLEEFAGERAWTMGREVRFIRRANWGIDQGARVDYFRWLASAPRKPKFIWQFQDHFLDLESPLSRYGPGDRDIDGLGLDGQVKGDVIADGAAIDLDANEAVLEARPSVGVLHASRGGLGFIDAGGRSRWYFADGGNCCLRTDVALRAFRPRVLDAHRAVYDLRGWTLFMELDWGRLLCGTGCEWYNVGDGSSVSPRHFDGAIARPGALLPASPAYAAIHARYRRRFERCMNLPSPLLMGVGRTRQRYWMARRRCRATLEAIGLVERIPRLDE